ncbi:MAG: GNAT family N-acetyltransferase [Proteobacteria bacterium]|nr:GNAT family N-acetyltransferase [Pseudomonadota bacterium]
MNKLHYTLRSFESKDREAIKDLMRGVSWPEHYVEVHANAAEKLSKDDEGDVLVAIQDNKIIALMAMKHQRLNFLTCVYTLVVAAEFHRNGLGKALLDYAEKRARESENRGIFLDTTDNNTNARLFYKAIGFHEAYTMPHYYLDDLDGITYLKLFNRQL